MCSCAVATRDCHFGSDGSFRLQLLILPELDLVPLRETMIVAERRRRRRTCVDTTFTLFTGRERGSITSALQCRCPVIWC